MPTDCDHCDVHADWKAEKAANERKLALICEECVKLKNQMDDLRQVQVHVSYIKSAVDDIKNRLNNDFVTMNSFAPVRMVTYGIVGLISLTVFGALLGRVLQ